MLGSTHAPAEGVATWNTTFSALTPALSFPVVSSFSSVTSLWAASLCPTVIHFLYWPVFWCKHHQADSGPSISVSPHQIRGIVDKVVFLLPPTHFTKQNEECPSPFLKIHVPPHFGKDELFWYEVVLFWLLLNVPEGNFEQALLTWIYLSHSFISSSTCWSPFFFFFLWKYLVTVYTLCAIYAVQSMKNTWKFLHCLSPQLHKSCITFCMATHFYGVMGSSLPAAPALGPQHPLGILVLQVWTLPGGQRRGEVQSPLSPIFMLLDRKISPSYCLVALQCLQHSRNLALLFVSILWKTRVMQRIFPQVQLVEYSKEMVFATGDAAVH